MGEDWRSDPATERQREHAAEIGIKLPRRCTKGQASDAISAAHEKVDRQRSAKLREQASSDSGKNRLAGLANAVSSVFGRRNTKQEPYERDPTHALSGTFDESEFVNPNTGRFKFPTYKHRKEFLVKIDDQTDYKGDIWEDLEADERREFDLSEFEDCSPCFDFEVDNFETFLGKPSNPYLGDLKALRGELYLITELLEALNANEFCILEDQIEKQLTKGGYVYARDFVSGEDKRELLNSFTVKTLRELAKPHKIKLGGKRDELLQRMIDSGVEFETPSAYVAGPKFYAWAEALADGYIAEVKKNAARFHPMMRADIWLMVDDCDFALVDDKVQAVRDSKYWLNDMA